MTLKNPGNPLPEVSIVVPNWQGGEWIGRCVSSLLLSLRGARVSGELIVVDDRSMDDSVSLLRRQFPSIRLLCNRRNRGFAWSVNRGAREARGRVLVLANNDLVAREGFVENLVRWFRGPEEDRPFAVSARTVGWYDGRPNQLCMGALWRGGRVTPAWADPGEATRCLFVQAGAAAYDRERFLALGGLDRLYEPGYWEDYDLSWRAARRGWWSLYDPDAFALHVGGGSMRRRYGEDGVRRLKARNHLLFEAANLRSGRLLAEWHARIPLGLARDCRRAPGERVYTQALADALPRLRTVLARRMTDVSVASDEELLEPFCHFQASY